MQIGVSKKCETNETMKPPDGILVSFEVSLLRRDRFAGIDNLAFVAGIHMSLWCGVTLVCGAQGGPIPSTAQVLWCPMPSSLWTDVEGPFCATQSRKEMIPLD
ncbi:hypothetical protein O181_023217 [Austropuccinia psidii MF-1]|uniref:Uncharacterized protein n=1 Tax=Austropuccinia psidii MF-1 TaxID=1389203 RepID=A0A9Q3CH03_9BASI|nr:hypothetical protein [Austropuccinia psidii MF-1]